MVLFQEKLWLYMSFQSFQWNCKNKFLGSSMFADNYSEHNIYRVNWLCTEHWSTLQYRVILELLLHLKSSHNRANADIPVDRAMLTKLTSQCSCTSSKSKKKYLSSYKYPPKMNIESDKAKLIWKNWFWWILKHISDR